jgi:immune inhibitor A
MALVVGGVGTVGPSASAAPAPQAPSKNVRGTGATDNAYINYVAPQAQKQTQKDVRVGSSASASARSKAVLDLAHAVDRKHAEGNPAAARQLVRNEQRAIKTGKNPIEFKHNGPAQKAKLLTLLVEFNENANDDFTGVQVPKTVFGDRTCVPGTIQNGPLHNNIPNPATYEAEDNNSFWVPNFSPAHYNKMLYTKKGITERVRKDLTGPDGKPGIDISGYTMRNHYLEMSKGAYTVDGEAVGWIEVPHSEAWYGANLCFNGDAGAPQGMTGHPDNPNGPAQMGVDAVNVLAEQQPDFPWEEYDQEDQADADGDGDVTEPDGIVDHLVLVHAGEGKSGGGGAQGTYAIWAHSSTLTTPHAVPGTDVAIANYIVQPEDAGVGVFSHEYGHDLGLPDLYDTSGAGDSDVDFWDLMSSGSHSVRSSSRCRRTWACGTSGCSAGPTRASSSPVTPRLQSSSARPRVPPWGPRTASASACRRRSSAWPTPTAASTCGGPAATRTGPTSSSSARSRSRPGQPTPGSGCGTTTSSRSCGTTASSRSRPTAGARGPSPS